LFVSQPDIPVPLVVEFPFPAWATRPAERGAWVGVDTGPGSVTKPADPFAGIPDDEPAPF
jgi:hypothetical protein